MKGVKILIVLLIVSLEITLSAAHNCPDGSSSTVWSEFGVLDPPLAPVSSNGSQTIGDYKCTWTLFTGYKWASHVFSTTLPCYVNGTTAQLEVSFVRAHTSAAGVTGSFNVGPSAFNFTVGGSLSVTTSTSASTKWTKSTAYLIEQKWKVYQNLADRRLTYVIFQDMGDGTQLLVGSGTPQSNNIGLSGGEDIIPMEKCCL